MLLIDFDAKYEYLLKGLIKDLKTKGKELAKNKAMNL